MQALKEVLEDGLATIAWSAVRAALVEQEQALQAGRQRDIAAPGNNPRESGASSPRSPAEHLQLRDAEEPRIVLDSAPLWKQFFTVTNEMIVTKAGRRMFPVLKLHVSQLDPTAMYAVVLEFRCTHQHRWRFLNGSWQKGSACEDHADQRHVFVHFASMALGSQWMQEPVSFAKLKLSNRENGSSKVKLNSLHKYQPHVHLIKIASDSCRAAGQSPLHITSFTFPETQFIAVTAYQNDKVTQMKIKNNPFAKAFLGGNASERLHNSSYVAPLELPNGFISHLSPIHPSLIPHSPPHTLTPHSPPPPYPGSYASQPSLQPYLQHQQQQPVFATQQGANYSMNPQIHHPQMTPRVMPHNHFVYQDYDGPYNESVSTQFNSCFFFDSSVNTEFHPDYLSKPPPIFSHDDDVSHAPLSATPSTISQSSDDQQQQCFYCPPCHHQTL